MRPIDFCTPKPSQLEHSCFAVSRRSGHLAMPFGDRAKARSRPGAARLRARPRERLFSRAAPPVRRRARRAPGSSGPPDANEAGENRTSRRDSHFGDRAIRTRRRFLPPCEIERPIAKDTLVASSVPFARDGFFRSARGLEGRQDRFRGGLVKGVRISDPGCLPPTDAAHTPPAPKHERSCTPVPSVAALT